MHDVSVLRIQKEHLAEVAEIESLCFSEPWSVHALELLLKNDQAVGFVCVTDGAVQAYGGMLIAPFEGQITNVAVHPRSRRQGLGKQILNALLANAEERGLDEVVLEVRVSNQAAISLYEASGFKTLGRRKGFYRSPTEDALVMGATLTPSSPQRPTP